MIYGNNTLSNDFISYKIHTEQPQRHLLRIKGPFDLTYFRAYIKQFKQINKFLCIIYRCLIKVVYEKTIYEDAIFVNFS